MTFYIRRVKELTDDVYPREDLTKRVIAAKQFIDRHFDEPIDLDALAREACLSKYHFLRVFKRYYGQTPHQYLVDVRVAKAKTLLRGGANVLEACTRVGYQSVTSFSTRFKSVTGSAPSEVQK